MLGFKFGNGLDRSGDYPAASPPAASIPKDAVILTRSNYSNTYWSAYSTANNYYITDAPNPANTGRVFSAFFGTGFTTQNISFASGGAHGSGTSTYTAYASSSSTGSSRFNAISAGGHSHSITLGTGNIGNVPYEATFRAWRSIAGQGASLPAGSIVFSASDLSGLGLITNSSFTDAHIRINNILDTSTSGSNLNGSGSASTDSAGSHNHTQGGSYNYNSGGAASGSVVYQNLTASAHSHTFSWNAKLHTRWVKLLTYQVNSETPISNGMILMYANTDLSLLPAGWYACNGQTVGSYTTPNLTSGRYIMMTNNISSNFTTPTANDENLYVITTNVLSGSFLHSHNGNPVSRNYAVSDASYHSSFAWNHNHNVSPLTFNYTPQRVQLNFIIFLDNVLIQP